MDETQVTTARERIAEVLHRWMGGDRDYYDAPTGALLAPGGPIADLVAAELDAAARSDDARPIRWPGASGQWLRDRATTIRQEGIR